MSAEEIGLHVLIVVDLQSRQPPPQLKKNQLWGHVFPKEVFEDLDALEGGSAREVISEECLSPVSTDKTWTNCYVERVDKEKYR